MSRFSPMRPPRLLAIDPGFSRIACGVWSAGKTGRLVLEQLAIAPQIDASPPEVGWVEQTSRSLAAVVGAARMTGEASVAIPGHLALVKFVKTLATGGKKRERVIEFEAAQSIPYPLSEVVWDCDVIAEGRRDLELMLTAAKREAVEALCHAADATGCSAARAIPACFALLHAFRFSYPEAAGRILLIEIGARSTHLLFIEPDRYLIRTLNFAGNAVTQSIAEATGLEFAAAEELKTQVLPGRSEILWDPAQRAVVRRAVDDFTSRLHTEIVRSTLSLRRSGTAVELETIFLTGGGSLMDTLPATLAARAQISVERFDPLRRVDVAPAAADAVTRGAAATLGTLVGLATSLVARNRREPSLLPLERRKELAFRRRQPVWLTMAALVVVALLPPIWRYHRVATSTAAEVAAVERRLLPLQSIERQNADRLARIEEALRQVKAIERVIAARSSWTGFLSALQTQLSLVEDVWLDAISIQNDSPAGESDVALRLALSGRLLDVEDPISRVSATSHARVKQLLVSFAAMEHVTSTEAERFDNSLPGILRFEVVLVMDPVNPL